jgi:hypothetical protein
MRKRWLRKLRASIQICDCVAHEELDSRKRQTVRAACRNTGRKKPLVIVARGVAWENGLKLARIQSMTRMSLEDRFDLALGHEVIT